MVLVLIHVVSSFTQSTNKASEKIKHFAAAFRRSKQLRHCRIVYPAQLHLRYMHTSVMHSFVELSAECRPLLS